MVAMNLTVTCPDECVFECVQPSDQVTHLSFQSKLPHSKADSSQKTIPLVLHACSGLKAVFVPVRCAYGSRMKGVQPTDTSSLIYCVQHKDSSVCACQMSGQTSCRKNSSHGESQKRIEIKHTIDQPDLLYVHGAMTALLWLAGVRMSLFSQTLTQ